MRSFLIPAAFRGHFAPGHFALGHFAPGHLSAGHFPIGHFPIGHFPGGHFAVGHTIVSALIHGLIWSLIFRLVAHLSLPELLTLVVLVVGGIWFWSRNRGVRRW